MAPPTSTLKILIIEDDLDTAQSLGLVLSLNGYKTDISLNGAEGIERAKIHTPDVVLLDLGLPGLNGYEVAKKLCSLKLKRPPFIIAMTGYGDAASKRLGVEAGIDLHLTKPVYPPILQSILRSFENMLSTSTCGCANPPATDSQLISNADWESEPTQTAIAVRPLASRLSRRWINRRAFQKLRAALGE